MTTRLWAVGDVHGCYDQMRTLLNEVPCEDQVIFLGDYVDRGPKILEVLHFVRDNRNNPRYIFLMGNHEQMLIEAREPEMCFDQRTFDAIPSNEWDYWQHLLNQLPDRHETDTNYFVHGGLQYHPNDVPFDQQSRGSLLWSRPDHEETGRFDYGKYLIHGHTPLKNVYLGQNRANIDTGACFHGYLTGGRIDDTGRIDKLIQAAYDTTVRTTIVKGNSNDT